MHIKSIEIANDYNISFRENAYEEIKKNKVLNNIFILNKNIEDINDIDIKEFVEACNGNFINIHLFLNRKEVIIVTFHDNYEYAITNIDIARIYNWNPCASQMILNYDKNYLMLTINGISKDENSENLMAIWDSKYENWVFSKFDQCACGMVYANDINKFLTVIRNRTKSFLSVALGIINPQDSFKFETILLHKEGIEKETGKIVNESYHEYVFNENIFEEDIKGCPIDYSGSSNGIYWDDIKQNCYVKSDEHFFKYSFLSKEKKIEFYDTLLKQIEALISDESNMIANLANSSALLFEKLDRINWAGFYLRDAEQLVLGPFQGKTACIRINMGRGVCGTAAEQGKTLVVSDVHDFPGHIACDSASRSEIVVPIIKDDKVYGVLDIDSPIKERFDEIDERYLVELVNLLCKFTDFNAYFK